MRITRSLALLFCAIVTLTNSATAQDTVTLKEDNLVIPTYRVGPPEKNPIFFSGRSYQGAKGPIYPYPILDQLTDTKQDHSYRAVLLENRYVQYSILPEIGGRIFSGQDKTNGYDFIYRQHVIKPALIGMVGAWISGGVEWNIPHHHRASTFMPVDYRLINNPDGSKTVWLGETELRHRMRWIVGLTLWPDRSYLKVTVKLFNRTPLPHSMLYFANIAVHANENYQVLFPPGTEFGTQHGKSEFVTWPIGSGRYGGLDRKGIDLSWWKNLPQPASIFAWNYEDDFFGGYDHGKQAGMLVWADHNNAPGKKFFEWGNGAEGKLWDKILTDTDGPYLELMAGGYSDNQPDYSWVQPGETKVVEQWFYPIRGLAGVKNATRDAAVNLEVANGTAKIAINTTADVKDARIVVTAGDKVILEEKANISPEKPWLKDLKVDSDDVRAALISPAGKELVAYRTQKRNNTPMPKPVVPPGKPETIKTTEELYLAGLRLEQFHSPALEPEPYYQEALKRDPNDYRANVAMGILNCRRGLYPEAEQYLKAAVDRAQRNYTRPKDGEALYYLGISLLGQLKMAEAEDALQRAAWSTGWVTPSCYKLAEVISRRGDYTLALQLIDRAIAANAMNTRSLCLKAILLRKLGCLDEAAATLAKIREIDPLDPWAAEESRIRMTQNSSEQVKQMVDSHMTYLRNNVPTSLEVALDYAKSGFFDEPIDILNRFVDQAPDKQRVNPLVHYYLGQFWTRKGDQANAARHYALAAKMPAQDCFPFQLEAATVLTNAMKANPADATAPYLLGNLLYDLQPAAAIKAWEQSAQLNPNFPTVHRNLGLAHAKLKDHAKAVAELEKAVACDPKDPKLYAELDSAYESANTDPAKRLAVLEKNHDIVKNRDDALLREIVLLMTMAKLDRAVELIESHHFHLWEGETGLHDVYADAHLLRGQRLFKEKKYPEAMADFDAALKYPENLETARSARGEGKTPIADYWRGLVFEANGNDKKAKECWESAVKGNSREFTESSYWQAQAWSKLDESMMAKGTFEGLVRYGKERLAATEDIDFFAKFGTRRSITWEKARAHYLLALGLLGQGKTDEAKKEFEAVLELNKAHLGARTMLANMN